MRLFIDACVPEPISQSVESILRGEHQVKSAQRVNWHKKKDVQLIRDAANHGFEAFLTSDLGQLIDPAEIEAIHRARIHHIRFRTIDGKVGLGLMLGVVAASILPVLDLLSETTGQRLVELRTPSTAKRFFTICDPRRGGAAPVYWPR